MRRSQWKWLPDTMLKGSTLILLSWPLRISTWGMPWLKKHNPVVNWKTEVLTFRNCTNNTAQTCYQPQKVWTDEGRSPQWNLTDRKDNSQEKRSTLTGTPQNQVAKQSEMKREEVVNPLEIPEEY